MRNVMGDTCKISIIHASDDITEQLARLRLSKYFNFPDEEI
jgi:hypothetical protein